MLDTNLKTQLKAYLEKVTQPFEIVASLDDGEKSQELLSLLQDIAGLSDKITLKTDGDDARKPSFSLNRIGGNISLRFAGIPMGHEFTSLVLALLQVGGHPSKTAPEVIEQIKALDGDYRFETYFSLSCQNCPDVVQALNLMAVLNPNIQHVAIDGPLFKGKRVAVIGGGNSGVEAAIDLAGIVAHVTLLEFGEELRADAVLQRKLNSLPNVRVLKMAQTTEVKGDGQKVTGLVYKDRNNDEMHEVELEGIFVQIGLLPNSEWLKGTLELSRFGEIIVDAKGQTSIPGVFAAGDVTTVPYKQIVIAVGEGAKASLSAFDHLIRSSAPA